MGERDDKDSYLRAVGYEPVPAGARTEHQVRVDTERETIVKVVKWLRRYDPHTVVSRSVLAAEIERGLWK
jgi:hypothetical protein